jgi:hypothetical protein
MKTNSRFVLFTNSDKSYKVFEGRKNIATYLQENPETPVLQTPEEVEVIRNYNYEKA